MIAAATSAFAQIRLPGVTLPANPLQGLPVQSLTQSLDTDAQALDKLTGSRRVEIGRLVRANRAVLETDPHGEPIVKAEILAEVASDEVVDRIRALGFSVLREQTLAAADLHILVVKPPPNLSTERALALLRTTDPQGRYDYNHIYLHAGNTKNPNLESAEPATASTTATTSPSAPPVPATRSIASQAPRSVPAQPGTTSTVSPTPPSVLSTPATASLAPQPSSSAPSAPAPAIDKSHIRVGLLDSGVDASHPVFRNSLVHAWGCQKPLPAAHGTAVASLMLTDEGTELYAADVYCGLPTGGAADLIVAALNWMASERVAVINVSLVGPSNVLLERAVNALIARGFIIVAAVGNDGPAAPPLYPASYANVVGVTGVDARRHVLLEAGRGPQVMFAAPGAGIRAAAVEHAFAEVRGTSFAAPAVARLLAASLSAPDKSAAAAAVESLATQAIDLGAPGRDLTYGFGLVGASPAAK